MHIKGSSYSIDNTVRMIDNISYIKEPTGYLCGQSCATMLAGVSVGEVIKVSSEDSFTGFMCNKDGNAMILTLENI